MSSDSDVEELLLLYALVRKRKRENESPVLKKKRRVWNKNVEKRKQGAGEYNRLCLELASDEDRFYEYFHMSQGSFEMLHEKLAPRISKAFTNFRLAISSRERLMVCLRFLVAGSFQGELARSFHLGRSTVSNIIRETCKEIYNVLQPICMPEPSRKIWLASEKGYQDIWDIPNCVGSLEGKHIAIKCPRRQLRYDKKNSRVAFLCIIDPWCKFTAIDIGDYGTPNENALFEETLFYKKYVQGIRKVLPSKPLPGTTSLVPHVFLVNEVFILQTNVLRPFPSCVTRVDEAKRKFNERISQPYSVVKETFDMLQKNFKIFDRPIEADLPTTYDIIKAACCLHNYIINRGESLEEANHDVAVGDSPVRMGKRVKKVFLKHKPTNRRWTAAASHIRDKFVDYFNKL